jgi:chemotaxis-related protein WspD
VSDWTNLLAHEKEDLSAGKESAVIFRLGREWLALPVHLFKEVTPVRVIHRLPHRTSGILLGIVNMRGEIRLCVSLKVILGIDDEPEEPAEGSRIYKRMAVVEKERDQWVIPVDEIHGIHRYNRAELMKVPVTIAKATVKFTGGMLPWQGKSVGFLDDELLFYSMRRSAVSEG